MASVDVAEYERIKQFQKLNNGRSSRSLGSGKGSVSVFNSEASVLSYIECEYEGMLPTRHADPAFARLIYNRFSCKDLTYKLSLTPRSAIYYLIIILLEAINVSGSLSMDSKSLEKIGDGESYRITWYKDRAGEFPIYEYFQRGNDSALMPDSTERIGVVNVIECLIDLQKRLRKFAIPSESESLFLVAGLYGPAGSQGKYRVGTLTEALENKNWHRIRREDPILAELPITLDQIRTSILLLEALETGNDLIRVNARAKHASYSTTVRYLRKLSTATLNKQLVREVHDFTFAAGTEKLVDVRQAMGMTPERAAFVISNARRKGFGGWTAIHEQGVDAEGKENTADNALENWLTSGEKIIWADSDVAAELHAFREHIIGQSSTLRFQETWAETWGPLLLFINMALEAMPPSIRGEGERRAEELELFYAELD